MKHLNFATMLAAFILVGCTSKTDTTRSDPYDPAKMDLKPVPASIYAERHTGPFASGKALRMDAYLKPLDPDAVKTIQLDTTHKIIEIAPGVKFSA